MKWFLLLLWSYLLPGIDDEPDDEPAEDDEADDEPAEDDKPTDEAPAEETQSDDEPPAPRESRAQRAIRETRDRAQTAERDLATARAELEVARRQPDQNAQPSQEQVLWKQEEETLRNPEATDWQRYAIQANRSARAATVTSNSALQRAEDLSDRSQFAALASTKPKLYAAYKDRVEAKLTELRGRGQNVPREGILKVLLGEDMLSGNLKSTESKAKSGAARTPRPSSDVTPSSGRLSDSEARAKRLENIRI